MFPEGAKRIHEPLSPYSGYSMFTTDESFVLEEPIMSSLSL